MIKVSIMGATGVIGKNVAFKLARTDVIDKIILYCREESLDKAKGEIYDMYDALSAENIDCDLIPTSNLEDLKDSNVVLITAGVPRKGRMDRLDLASTNAKIVREYAKQIAIHAPDTIIVVATNPVDVMTTIAYKASGFERSRVIGVGNHLDSLRLKTYLARHFNIHSSEVHTRVIGEHGNHMVPLLSSTTIGGIPLRYFIETSDLDTREIIQRLRHAGKTIIKKKGATEYGPSYAISNLIITIVRDHHKILSVSTYLKGEIEGVHDVSLGVPAIISQHGVKMVIKINMHNIERAEFLAAAKTIHEATAKVEKQLEEMDEKEREDGEDND